jgi:type II secretory pathway pseudopilin PulG
VAPVAILIFLAIAGILAAIAIPSFVKARDIAMRQECVNNLKQIDSAKQSAALEHNYKAGAIIPEDQVSKYLNGGMHGMVCPKGGNYTPNPLGREPECSIHGSLSEAGQSSGSPAKVSKVTGAEAAPQPQR